MGKSKMSATRRRSIAIWSILLVVVLSFALPLASYSVHWLGSTATAQDATEAAVNPRSDMWRAVRSGEPAYSAIKGPGANVLVQSEGNDWRLFRESPLVTKLPWAIVGMAAILLLYHLIIGKNKLDVRSLSGRKILRWRFIERVVHWTTAVSFLALAVTGISLMLGKKLLIPYLGKAGFAAWAGLSIQIHNTLGPLLAVCIVLMILMWAWHNIPTMVDVKWVLKGGGLFSKNHPSAGRMNAGEKMWFWLLATLGVAVCVSGIILVSPMYPQYPIPGLETARSMMQDASMVHMIGAVIWTAVALGHIYIGTAGTEGAFEGMATGYVSAEWAEQHHDLWYEKMSSKGKVQEPNNDMNGAPSLKARVRV